MAYSNADEVELFLNGKSLGRKKRFGEPVEIPVGHEHQPGPEIHEQVSADVAGAVPAGTLKAVAYQNGKQVAVDEVRTAGAPAKVKLIADRTAIHADGDDLSFVTVRMEDKDGNLCPDGRQPGAFRCDRARARSRRWTTATPRPWNHSRRTIARLSTGWRCLIVRSKHQAGKIHVTATSEGLSQATVDIASGK